MDELSIKEPRMTIPGQERLPVFCAEFASQRAKFTVATDAFNFPANAVQIKIGLTQIWLSQEEAQALTHALTRATEHYSSALRKAEEKVTV